MIWKGHSQSSGSLLPEMFFQSELFLPQAWLHLLPQPVQLKIICPGRYRILPVLRMYILQEVLIVGIHGHGMTKIFHFLLLSLSVRLGEIQNNSSDNHYPGLISFDLAVNNKTIECVRVFFIYCLELYPFLQI